MIVAVSLSLDPITSGEVELLFGEVGFVDVKVGTAEAYYHE
ncbi:MAG: hypothetical protein U0T83_06390 [Bacteriovoracaceae bacterium]